MGNPRVVASLRKRKEELESQLAKVGNTIIEQRAGCELLRIEIFRVRAELGQQERQLRTDL